MRETPVTPSSIEKEERPIRLFLKGLSVFAIAGALAMGGCAVDVTDDCSCEASCSDGSTVTTGLEICTTEEEAGTAVDTAIDECVADAATDCGGSADGCSCTCTETSNECCPIKAPTSSVTRIPSILVD